MSSPEKKSGLAGLTPNETKLLLLGVLCTQGAKVDYEKLAELGNIKKSSAGTMYIRAKQKLEKSFDTESPPDDSSPVKVKQPVKRRKKPVQPQPRTETETEADVASEDEGEPEAKIARIKDVLAE